MTIRKVTITVPSTPTLDELEAEAQAAINKAAQARAAAEQVRQRAEQARARAEREHDQQVLEQWRADRAQLDADVETAREKFNAAVLDNPVFAALRDYLLAAHRRTTRSFEAGQITGRVHGPDASFGPIPSAPLPAWEELVRLVERAATAQGQGEAAAREQARVDAGQAAADREAGR